MCGIAGLVYPQNKTITPSTIESMGQKLSHRGPDNFSYQICNHVAFSHNRLSILDLSDAGNQPFMNERYILTFNGEIYNFLELKKSLIEKGIQFKSSSDTEVLFYHCIHYGVESTLDKLEGMFAFSFYDVAEDNLYLCRDRLGIKPLYWIYKDGVLAWASEVKAIAAVMPIEADPIRSLASIQSIGDHSNRYTVFRDVENLPPGHFLNYQSGGNLRISAYYNILDDIDESYYHELERASLDEIVSQFQELLTKSVQKMLISDAPIGSFVSGGIDSSLISSIALRFNQDLHLFSANVLGDKSEIEDARLLSRSINRPLHEFAFEPQMMLSTWAEATYHYEAPIIAHTNALPFSRVAKLAHQHNVKAVLTGEGSDELFLGYPKLLTQRYLGLLRWPITLLENIYGLVPQLKAYLFPSTEQSIEEFHNLLIQNFERQQLRAEGYKAYHFIPAKQLQNQYLSIQLVREHLISLLHRNDRMGMLAGIEARFPFLDESIIRFSINLPVKHKMAWTSSFHNIKHPFLLDKAVVRKAAQKLLPKSLAEKQKNGFPMYGHANIRIQPSFFEGSYVADALKMKLADIEFMVANMKPYHLAKLASVDIFGSLFAMNQSIAEVTERVEKLTRMEIAS